jgi:uroporphyrin-III C-methyltransferase
VISVGKHEGEQEVVQNRIFSLILDRALAGKSVARLKGGDPLVFGRGAEEWALALEHGIPVELIPGVTSATSVPGLAGIPLTYRQVSQSFGVIAGHCSEDLRQDWDRFARIDTLVVLMGVKNRALIAQALIDAGRDPHQPVAFIERGTTPAQRVITSDLRSVALGQVAVENPAVFVIGEVVKLREKLAKVSTDIAELLPV